MDRQLQPPQDYDRVTRECVLCDCYHTLPFCRIFLAMTTSRRRKALRRHGLCFICLSPSHTPTRCTSMETCQRCGDLHHTLLHETSAIVLPLRKKRARRRVFLVLRNRAVKQAAKRKRMRKAKPLRVGGFFERDLCPGPTGTSLVRKRLSQERTRVIYAAAMLRTTEQL